MKILSAEQIREADKHTIDHEPVPSIELMERAATVCVEWITCRYSVGKKVVIVCGPGNNGGDGLAIARLLQEKWYDVRIFILKSGNYSRDFSINMERIRAMKMEYSENDAYDEPVSFDKNMLIIDAIFGTGLSRSVEGWIGKWIDAINASGGEVISIDLPSGLFADKHSSGTVVKATHTLCFQCPRLAFLFPENSICVGEFHVLDIGLDVEFIETLPCDKVLLESKAVSVLLKSRPLFSHKGIYGHALILSGSKGKMGAAILAAKACLRSGSGLLTVHLPAAGYEIMQVAVPEAMVSIDEKEGEITTAPDLSQYKSIAIGPGIGTESHTVSAVEKVLQTAGQPLLLDADALNCLALNKELLKKLPADSILTPHPKEFERLAGKSTDDFHRHERQLTFSIEHRCYVILKGAYSCITTPDGRAYFNSTGNPGMAKGGSGDVLTGVLAGLRAQGYSPLETCLIGVYVHGLAGDLAAAEFGKSGMLPTDLIDMLGDAIEVLMVLKH